MDARSAKSDPYRVKHLEQALGALLDALDRQHFEGRPPGKYAYSMNVEMAMERAHQLVFPPPPAPKPHPDDVAREVN